MRACVCMTVRVCVCACTVSAPPGGAILGGLRPDEELLTLGAALVFWSSEIDSRMFPIKCLSCGTLSLCPYLRDFSALVMESVLSFTGCMDQPREGVIKPEANIFHVQEGLRHNSSGHNSWVKDRPGGNFCRNSQDLGMGSPPPHQRTGRPTHRAAYRF